MTLAFIVVLTSILVGFWYAKHAGRKLLSPAGLDVKSQNPYAAVEIRCGLGACSGARALQGTKLLAASAPALPLPYCRADSCRCGYSKLEDRREERRRSIDDGIEPLIFSGVEQRYRGDRRTG